MQIDVMCQVDLNRLRVGRIRAIQASRYEPWFLRGGKGSYAEDHHFCGLDEGGGDLPFFQTHFANRIGGDH
jgi:hypothetical protein